MGSADVWPNEYEPIYAVRADEATPDEAVAAVAEYAACDPAALSYEGIRVVNLPTDEHLKGRRRRAHIVKDNER